MLLTLRVATALMMCVAFGVNLNVLFFKVRLVRRVPVAWAYPLLAVWVCAATIIVRGVTITSDAPFGVGDVLGVVTAGLALLAGFTAGPLIVQLEQLADERNEA